MMVTKRLDVRLYEEELDFIKWMAKRDNLTLKQEMDCIFNTELRALMDLYLDEMKMEAEQR